MKKIRNGIRRKAEIKKGKRKNPRKLEKQKRKAEN